MYIIYMYVVYIYERKKEICFKELTQAVGLWGLTKFTRHASKLEILAKVGIAVMNPKTGNSGSICVAIWRAESLPAQRPLSFLLMPSTDWIRPTHVMEGYLLYSKSPGLNVNLKNTFTTACKLLFDWVS